MKKILLIGKEGQIGWELQRTLSTLGEVHATDLKILDLADTGSIRTAVQTIRPQVIVNAGAYTAVDKAETESSLNTAINAKGPGILAEEAKRCGAILVHFSTDYVFDGSATIPMEETNPTRPLNAYGEAKLKGEKAIIATSCKHLIFRTSWIYANRGKNFLLTMLNLAKSKPSLSIVNDQFGAPTWARSVAEATAQILAQSMNVHHNDFWGIYNMTCGGSTTWHGFAEAIFNLSKQDATPELIPITTAEYPTPAKRPAYSVLDNRKLHNTFHVNLPTWKNALELCLEERSTP